jgi:signal transduction histidine kinase
VVEKTSLIQRVWDIAGAVSVRVKVLGIVMGVVTLLGILVTLQVRQILLDTLTKEIEQQGKYISEHVVTESLLLLEEGDPEQVSAYLDDMQHHYSNPSHNTKVSYIYLTDSQNHILAQTSELPPRLPQVAEAGLSDSAAHTHTVQTVPDSNIIEVTTAQSGVALHLGLSKEDIQRDVNSMIRRVLYITALMLLIGVAAAMFLTWVLTRPILNLVDATEAIAKGDFSKRVSRWANDEIGTLAEAFNSMAAALEVADQERQQQEALRNQYISGVILAQEEERKRIARELHDSTSQSLTSLLVGLRTLESIEDPKQMEAHLADLRGVVGNTLEEVHVISRQLRPSVLDDLGLEAALQRYVDETQARHKLQIDLVILGVGERLQTEVETTAYRIVQEALTNIVRHAQATTASILLENRNQLLRIIIEDNGIGFDPGQAAQKQQSLGLQGMRERVSLFGGKMTIESSPGQGSSLFLEIPMR